MPLFARPRPVDDRPRRLEVTQSPHRNELEVAADAKGSGAVAQLCERFGELVDGHFGPRRVGADRAHRRDFECFGNSQEVVGIAKKEVQIEGLGDVVRHPLWCPARQRIEMIDPDPRIVGHGEHVGCRHPAAHRLEPVEGRDGQDIEPGPRRRLDPLPDRQAPDVARPHDVFAFLHHGSVPSPDAIAARCGRHRKRWRQIPPPISVLPALARQGGIAGYFCHSCACNAGSSTLSGV